MGQHTAPVVGGFATVLSPHSLKTHCKLGKQLMAPVLTGMGAPVCLEGRVQAAAGDLGRQGAMSRQGPRAGIGLSISSAGQAQHNLFGVPRFFHPKQVGNLPLLPRPMQGAKKESLFKPKHSHPGKAQQFPALRITLGAVGHCLHFSSPPLCPCSLQMVQQQSQP